MAITLDGTNGITTPDLAVDTNTLFVDATNNLVGVGTSSPAYKLDVNGNIRVPAGGNFLFGTGDTAIAETSGALRFFANGPECARIDSSGNLLVGTTSLPSASSFGFGVQKIADGAAILNSRNTTGGATQVGFFNPNGLVGTISTSGSSTAYNTSSDYRLKENVVPLAGAADRLAQIPVHRFNFIADPDRTVDGFLAHEVQEFVPECVTGEKDQVDDEGNPVYQGIDQSKLVPLLTAALQEALTKIDALEARIVTLEGGAA